MDLHKRLSYLHEISEFLQANQQSLSSQRLVSFYGHVAHEISLKNQIHSHGSEIFKSKRCKCCRSLYDYKNVKIKNKKFIIQCSNCGLVKTKLIKIPFKTSYEKKLESETNT